MSPERVAVVTGAGSGIGRATALALARAGYSLGLAGRRVAPLEEVAEQIRAEGGRAIAVACDVAVEADVVRLFTEVKQQFGRVDVLFNNAGGTRKPRPIYETGLDDWMHVLSSNLTGAFLCTREAYRIMMSQQPQGGRIINNGSVSAHAPRPGAVDYTAAKHGIAGLTKQTALEGRRHSIACGQIDIGNAASTPGDVVVREQPDGSMMGEPRIPVEHVADAVVHMAGLPLGTNILSMTVMATAMPFVGRG